MKKFICSMIALAIAIPMMAESYPVTNLKDVEKQYSGYIKVGLSNIHDRDLSLWQDATAIIEKGTGNGKFDISIRDFKFGSILFKKVTIKDAELQPTEKGLTYVVPNNVSGTIQIENTTTGRVSDETVEIVSGSKFAIVGNELKVNLNFIYNLSSFYTLFEGETKTSTGIAGIQAYGSEAKAVYDMSGRPVSKPRKGTCYIVNGKKMIVR